MGWDRLQELRAKGQRPLLPVFITTEGKWKYRLPRSYLVIEVKPGEAFRSDLLEGLDVILALGCDRAARVVKAINDQNIVCRSVTAWCPCTKEMVVAGWDCSTMAKQAKEW
jgi:hypothetical protein